MRYGSILLACLIISIAARADAPRFEELATNSISDLQATVSVIQADHAELRKISRDFGLAYRLKSVLLRFKRPGKLRMDGRIGQESALYIVNGSTRFYSVPKLNLNKKDDLGNSPGRRYSLLELGILSRGDLALVESKHLRTEMQDGEATEVFEIGYKGDNSVRYILWIDSRTRIVRKREWYDSAGKLKASFIHLKPREILPGLWMPTRLEVRNEEGAVAASLEYTELKINQNLADALFSVS